MKLLLFIIIILIQTIYSNIYKFKKTTIHFNNLINNWPDQWGGGGGGGGTVQSLYIMTASTHRCYG